MNYDNKKDERFLIKRWKECTKRRLEEIRLKDYSNYDCMCYVGNIEQISGDTNKTFYILLYKYKENLWSVLGHFFSKEWLMSILESMWMGLESKEWRPSEVGGYDLSRIFRLSFR